MIPELDAAGTLQAQWLVSVSTKKFVTELPGMLGHLHNGPGRPALAYLIAGRFPPRLNDKKFQWVSVRNSAWPAQLTPSLFL
jgi:hypothetical protein